MYAKKAYSPLEQKILDAIPSDGTKISTIDLVPLVYDGRAPLTARQSVLDCANKLIVKVDYNQELYEIFRSQPRGPMPIYFWIEARKASNNERDFFSARASL